MSHSHAIDTSTLLARDNVQLPADSGKLLSAALVGLGALAIGVTFAAGLLGDAVAKKAAIFGYHVGFVLACGLALGALGFVMTLYLTNGGWGVAVRRQFENLCHPVNFLLLAILSIPMIVLGESLFKWQDPNYTLGDPIFEVKQAFLNDGFFLGRLIAYFATWIGLAYAMNKLSRDVDTDGDKWKFAKAKRISHWGMILYALTVAFAGFDWLMSLDYHFFSTMWGVYFFAGNLLSALAFTTIVLIALTSFGRLRGVVTEEHFHDMGKLVFGFTVFWAYIAFSQYFLIWYANIPEETSWLMARRESGWMTVSVFLVVGKFILPFLFLIPRPVRRTPALLLLVCAWLLFMHMVEIFWIVRPQMTPPVAEGAERVIFYGGPLKLSWLDFVGPVGPVLLLVGLVLRRIATGPLIPIKDPRLTWSLSHKNYI
ncbi:MAG: hypothetical protein KF684_07985 [Phycisphaeraceae bacterium]|nr:hypothetical protein [Phycisphaeraceae bacterium]